MNRLVLTFTLVPDPYLREQERTEEVWGQIELSITGPEVFAVLLRLQWDIAEIVEWLLDSFNAIATAGFPDVDPDFFVLPNESLVQAVRRIASREFADNERALMDQWDDALYEFRAHHNLQFGLRGTDTPAIYIGYNRGVGEISFMEMADDGGPKITSMAEWAFLFDLEDFRRQTKDKAIAVLQQWLNEALPHYDRSRAEGLLQLLRRSEAD